MKYTIPIAPMSRIMKSQGAQRVSRDASEALNGAMMEYAEDLSSRAVDLCHHAGRQTVTASDIKLALKQF